MGGGGEDRLALDQVPLQHLTALALDNVTDIEQNPTYHVLFFGKFSFWSTGRKDACSDAWWAVDGAIPFPAALHDTLRAHRLASRRVSRFWYLLPLCSSHLTLVSSAVSTMH